MCIRVCAGDAVASDEFCFSAAKVFELGFKD